MVRITQDVWEFTNAESILAATEGSIATAMSYEEYRDYIINETRLENTIYLQYVKQWMEQGTQFPFMLVEVAPVIQARYGKQSFRSSKTGDAVVLDEKFFQVIDG
jgi:hypothetical protein